MQKAELTLVPSTMPLAELLERMRDSGHAAALVQLNGGLTIVTADQVFRHLRNHRDNPQTAQEVSSHLQPSFLPHRSQTDSWTRRPETTHGLSFALDSGEGKYAILKTREDRALVMTADPVLAESFNMRISLCRCRSYPDTHVFQPHELKDPGQCNLDESKVDCC